MLELCTNVGLVSWQGVVDRRPIMPIANLPAIRACRPAWNKGRVVGQKRPLLPKHVWAIRVRLEIALNHRDLALFNLAIDSKLRGCDLVKLRSRMSMPRARSRNAPRLSRARHSGRCASR